MGLEPDDSRSMAAYLGIVPREFSKAIPGPWWNVTRRTGDGSYRGAVFVGREGPSVCVQAVVYPNGEANSGLDIDRMLDAGMDPEDIEPSLKWVEVGPAAGQWIDPGTLAWAPGEPVIRLDPLQEGFLVELAEAIRLSEERKAPQIRECRRCKERLAEEHMMGELCHGCASVEWGIVF